MAFVRVLLPNGYEASLSAEYAAAAGLQVLDKPATGRWGRPLPACLSIDPPPTPPPSEVDVDVWPGNGPPPTPPPAGFDATDIYIDLISGDVSQYTQE